MSGMTIVANDWTILQKPRMSCFTEAIKGVRLGYGKPGFKTKSRKAAKQQRGTYRPDGGSRARRRDCRSFPRFPSQPRIRPDRTGSIRIRAFFLFCRSRPQARTFGRGSVPLRSGTLHDLHGRLAAYFPGRRGDGGGTLPRFPVGSGTVSRRIRYYGIRYPPPKGR